ncbi:uncharacterized protein B0H18DRAFT_1088114 [Fomitopsis serialis]|uniref:uncharacterized protein n=1 Tax=Fomitopsis serialis TaxID=139415 RepID=UPI0020076C90|nr:uncharacterized protein B0H18DRAFT_1088114 [Neoantrodia serialis]KAH9913290.1 hypothetical protein B0H18DRAFT_1088114 [Neoantrodia serialis]
MTMTQIVIEFLFPYYLVCNHEWSFLEGNRSHAHTLKAGRHLFPFQLQIGGSLPSSIATSALGGASCTTTARDRETWPEKLMYSIMIPHKAWAAGEKVTAVVKFSPLVKGARVLNVTTTINETIKLYSRSGMQESTRVISSTRHDIWMDTRSPPSHPPSPLHHTTELAPLTTTTTNSSQSSGHGAALRTTLSAPTQQSPARCGAYGASVDIVTTLNITVPMHATPSHSLEPIQVTHRIRWSILIGNLDGHTSELRSTLHTRRILLGPQDIEGGTAQGTHGDDNTEEDMDLPSYSSHVRDRVANAYLPDTAALRVVNPWVMQGVSPTIGPPRSEGSSGLQSPAALRHGRSRTPRTRPITEPTPDAAPLEWVNTELLLSLSREAPEMPVPTPPQPANPSPPTARTPPEPSSSPGGSRSHSRFPSRRPSRANSRAASPERGVAAVTPGGTVNPGDTFVHNGSHASRNMHSLFNIAMKPFTSLGSTFSLSSRNPSHSNLHGHGHGNSPPHMPGAGPTGSGALSASASSINLASLAHHPQTPQPMTTPEQLHYAFTEVPDYDMASRGFLGGGITPLSSLQGLPSYDDAARERNLSQTERSFSDTDLAGMFAAAQRQGRTVVPRVMPRTTASTPPPPS